MLKQQGQTFFLLSTECVMNWGEWYPVPNKIFVSNMKTTITFSKAASELKTKNAILPDSFLYFLDFRQIDNYNKVTEDLKKTVSEEIRNNDFDNEIGNYCKDIK